MARGKFYYISFNVRGGENPTYKAFERTGWRYVWPLRFKSVQEALDYMDFVGSGKTTGLFANFKRDGFFGNTHKLSASVETGYYDEV